jgi:outer membrane protein assembly factor BamB
MTGGYCYGSSPAVANGRVYIYSYDGKFYCLNTSTGELMWNYTTGSQEVNWVQTSSPAVAHGKVYFGSQDNKVYCLDVDTGAKIWDYTTGNYVLSSPAIADDKVYIGSKDGTLYCFGVSNDPPVANFTYTINELEVTFNASSSYDPDGNITTWSWDFGDGATGTGELVTYHYLLSGTYNVTLTVADDDGNENNISQEITVEKEPEFQTAIIFGRITNLSSQGDYITFEAVKTRVITFSTCSFNTYESGEQFTISKDYLGFINVQFIFALCKILI